MRLKFLQNKDNYIWLILVLALVLRLGAFFSFQPWEDMIENEYVLHADANLYHDFALKIKDLQYPFSDRVSPGFPFFIAMIYYAFGVKPWLVLLFNIIFNMLCIYSAFQLAKIMFGDRIAIFCAFLLTMDIHQIIFTQTLLTDTSFTLLIVSSFLFFIKNFKDKRLIYLFFGGILLAIAALFRPIGVYLYLFLVSLIIMTPKIFFREKMIRILSFLTGYFIIIAPILGINFFNFGHLGVSRLGGLNFLYVNAMSVYEIQGNMSHEESIKMVERKIQEYGGDSITNPNVKEKMYFTVGMKIIRENSYSYLVNHLNGSINIYTSLSTYNIARILGMQTSLQSDKFFGYPVYLQVDSFLNKKSPTLISIGLILILVMTLQYLSTAVGIYVLVKKRKIFELALLMIPIIYLTLVTGVVGNARFKLPISPFLFTLSSVGIVHIYEKWKKKKITELR